MNRTAVYRCYAKDCTPLYIGCSGDFPTRLAYHMSRPWWPECEFITVQWFECWPVGLEAERAAILSEKPRENRRKDAPKTDDIQRAPHQVFWVRSSANPSRMPPGFVLHSDWLKAGAPGHVPQTFFNWKSKGFPGFEPDTPLEQVEAGE